MVQDPNDIVHKAETNRLEIFLLGRFYVRISGADLPYSAIKGRKARSLLKLLAIQPHHQIVRDRAMDILWPNLTSTAAAAQLYKAIHHVRKGFAEQVSVTEDWLEINDDLVGFSVPGAITTDVQQFEQKAREGLKKIRTRDLEAAISIYTGDLLPMDLYDEWTELPREHYRQLFLDVLLTLAEKYEQQGELSEAAEMLRLALAKDSVLESAHRGLMQIFARQGQANRALRQYELCHEALEKELGIPPSSETDKMLNDIRERRFIAETKTVTFNETSPGPVSPIIGRERECVIIEQTLDNLTAGNGSAIIIEGPVGIGKTRLIQELALRARQRHFDVFSGNARETEGSMPFGPFTDIMEMALQKERSLEELIPQELGKVMTTLSTTGKPVPNADRLAARGYLFAQIYRFFYKVASIKPTVLVLEDLHAADQGSLDLFRYLIRQIGKLPVLLVTSIRTDSSPLSSPLSDLHLTDAQEIAPIIFNLRPLTIDQHDRLIEQQVNGTSIIPENAEKIFQLSEGNPLFATELLRFQSNGNELAYKVNTDGSGDHLKEIGSIPLSLQVVVEQQLKKISTAAYQLLCIAAVIGRQISYSLLVSVWNQNRGAVNNEEQSLFDLLEEILKGGLLDERGLVYFFRHALFREAIYQSISEPRRRALHALIAQKIVETSRGSSNEPIENIAYHYLHAGDQRQAVHYLISAGERAENVYAHDDALRILHEAISLLNGEEDMVMLRTKGKVYERIGDVYRACGRLEQSFEAYVQALELYEGLPLNNPELVELHRKVALVSIFRTEMDKAGEHLKLAYELVGNDTLLHARLLIIEALLLWHFNKQEEACHLAHEALDFAEEAGAKAEASQACEVLAMTYLPLGRWEEGLKYEMRRHTYGWSPDIVVATDAHLCLWEYHVGGEQPFQQAQAFLHEVAKQANHLGDLRCVAVCHYALGTMQLWRGETLRAEDELDISFQLHSRVGSPAGMAYVLARMGVLHTISGAMELGWQAVQDGLHYAKQASVRDHCLQRLYGVGLWNRMEAGDFENAGNLVARSEELLSGTNACGVCALELYPWLYYYHLRTDTKVQAQIYAKNICEMSSVNNNPLGQAFAAIVESYISATHYNKDGASQLQSKAFHLIESVVSESSHSPVVRFLDLMVDQQKIVR